MVAALWFAQAQCADPARARRQSQPAIRDGGSSGRERKRLRSAGQVFPAHPGQFQSEQAAAVGRLSPNSVAIPPPNPFNLITAQLTVAYTLDVWGQNQRAVESQQALADFQHFQVEAAYLSLTSNVVVAAITEASLRAQISATEELIHVARDIVKAVRTQFEQGGASRVDLALQEANLATLEATLPSLRKALAIQRDLLAALTGRPPSEEPPEIFRLADLHLRSIYP
jgi:outer membrane protein TolC